MTTIGALIGTGRSADIYEFGEGRVLRRGRSGPIPVPETDIRMRIGEPESFVHATFTQGTFS